MKFCSNDLLDNNEITASVTEDIIIRAQTEVLRRKKIELYLCVFSLSFFPCPKRSMHSNGIETNKNKIKKSNSDYAR